jgi:hypothetical protein
MQHTEEYFEAECVTPTEFLRRIGQTRIDLLKLNVEGAEYAICGALFDAGIQPDVLCITFDEVHTKIDQAAEMRLRELIGQIDRQGYQPLFLKHCSVTYARRQPQAAQLAA